MPSLGTISGLGVGSKLDLQGTLDKLRQVDNAAVTALQAKKPKLRPSLSPSTVSMPSSWR